VNVNKKIFSIWSVLLILVVSIAVVVPGCGDGACTGDIEVRATLCDLLWEGDVVYKLTGPGAAAPTIIDGTSVNATHSGVDCGDWTCEYVSGGPLGAYFVDITPDPTQEVTSNSTKTFIINFELDQDAWIDWVEWTVDGMSVPVMEEFVVVEPCQVIDVHFVQGVYGCEERIVAVNETSRLWIHYLGWNLDGPPVEQTLTCGGIPPSTVWVVNDLCAVNKTAPAEKVSQNTTYWGDYVPKGVDLPLFCCELTELDVETIWMLEKETEYLKSIRWLGISVFAPALHPCVLFELVVQPVAPGWYAFSLIAEAEVELMDDDDVNTQNNIATSPPLTIWMLIV